MPELSQLTHEEVYAAAANLVPRQVPQHHYELQHWFCLFETPELGRHLIRATGVTDEKVVRRHILQMHPNMKIIDLHPLRDHSEIVDAAAKLAADPNWTPLTNQGLQESANAVSQEQTTQLPADVLNNPTSRPIVDASGRPIVPQTSPQAAPQVNQQQTQAIPVQP